MADLARDLIEDYTRASVTSAERAMLDYASKLTTEPWSITREDIECLRQAGWNDSAVLDLNLVISYFAFVNRVADGLGVEVEAEVDPGPENADGTG